MKDLIRKIDFEKFSIYLLVLCTFGIIGTKTINISDVKIYVEIVGIAAVLFIIIQLVKIFRGKYDMKEYYTENKYIIILFFVYVIISLIKMTMAGTGDLIYELNYNLPYILFLFLLLYFKSLESEMKVKLYNFITYIFIISFIFALIMFFMGYTNGAFSFDKLISLISFDECRKTFGEIRLYWLLSHKSRFTVYCYIGFIFIIRNGYINKWIKYFGILLSAICAVLSNSMMGIVIYVALVFIYIIEKYKLIEKVKQSKKAKIGLAIFCVVGLLIGIVLLVIISEKRNLSTLGSRTFIWSAGVEVIKENITGIGVMPDYMWLPAHYNNDILYFTNAHNVYLNRIIETGIVPGVLFIIFNISIIIKYIKSKDMLFTCMLIFTLLGYCNFESLNVNELPYILFMSYCIFFYKKGLKLK